MAKRKSSEEKRNRIRHAAYVCFRENGYHNTSIDDICEAADISKGSFYWHYGAKIDIFVDILEVWTREVVDELLSQFEAATLSTERVSKLSKAFEKEFHRARAIVPLWAEFTLYARRDREIQISLAKFYRRARAAIAEILRQSASDRLTEDQIQGSAAMILGAYTGIIMQDIADPSIQAERWAASFMSVLGMLMRAGEKTEPIGLGPLLGGNRVSNNRLQQFLSEASVKECAVFNAMRDMILRIAPHADEKYIRGWNVVAYNSNGLVCHLKMKNGAVELALYQGAQLKDPKALGVKRGKQRTVVAIDASKPIPKGVEGLISQSFSEH